MAVVEIAGGKVIATYQDVADVAEALEKYPHLSVAQLAMGNHPEGTLFANGAFTPPVIPSRPPAAENPVILGMRDLADDIGPAAVAKIEQRFGPRQVVSGPPSGGN